jgi:hypothetical protein
MFEFFQSKTKRLQNKIDKYISIEREQDVIKSSIDELAEAFQERKVARDSIMKSQSDDEIKKSVESRYDRFITSHLKEIGDLRRRRDDVEKSLNSLIKGDEEFVGLVETEKFHRQYRAVLTHYRNDEMSLEDCDALLKAVQHKYIRKELKNGEWVYTYRDTKVRTKLEKALKKVGSEIVKLKYEQGYCFDENGNEIFNHTDHEEKMIDISRFQDKLKNNIFTHNHPNNNELSIYDMDVCLSSQMKETRSTSLDSQYGKGTYVMKNDLKEPFNMKDHTEELNKSYDDGYDNKQETHKNKWIDVLRLSSFFEEIKDSVHFSFEKDNGEVIKL